RLAPAQGTGGGDPAVQDGVQVLCGLRFLLPLFLFIQREKAAQKEKLIRDNMSQREGVLVK
ncbi:MAG: hypothetical protein IJO15_01245, partial [Clostridia bacterium]|nr:hypothetical protein [Clostridia bacterium]